LLQISQSVSRVSFLPCSWVQGGDATILSAILESKDPVIFMEPKILYRAAVEQVPEASYTLPLSKAEIVKSGTDLTIVSYGRPMYSTPAQQR
jgi:pyruvate/2-oxoglutarate/acetoin dehydrogenase E1 component